MVKPTPLREISFSWYGQRGQVYPLRVKVKFMEEWGKGLGLGWNYTNNG